MRGSVGTSTTETSSNQSRKWINLGLFNRNKAKKAMGNLSATSDHSTTISSTPTLNSQTNILAGSKKNTEARHKSQWSANVRSYVALFTLLGLTWALYMLYIHEFGKYFSYLFIVLNGLQGVFIFVFKILFDKSKQRCFAKKWTKWRGESSLTSFTWSTETKTSGSEPSKNATNNGKRGSSGLASAIQKLSHKDRIPLQRGISNDFF